MGETTVKEAGVNQMHYKWKMDSIVLQIILAAILIVILLTWLHMRPLGLLLFTFLAVWIYKTRSNFRVVPPPELQLKVQELSERVSDWRRNQPTMFCAVASGCLGILAIIGHFMSGANVVLVLLAIAAVLAAKYNFRVVKIEMKDFAWSNRLNHNNENEFDDEFMPDVNDETNLFVLERASDLATISSPTDDDEEKSDEIPSELLIPDSIPEIDERSSEDDDDDLVPITRKSTNHATVYNGAASASTVAATDIDTTEAAQQSSQLLATTSESGPATSSSSAPKDVIRFRKGHFKRDSSLSSTSSSSQESLSKGLQFPDHTAIDGPSLRQLMDGGEGINIAASMSEPHNQEAANIMAMAVKSQTQALLAQSTKLLPSLVSSFVQWGSNNVGGGGGGGAATATATAAEAVAAQPTSLAPALEPLQAPATAPVQRRMVTALDSSDDSDFEILETDDFE